MSVCAGECSHKRVRRGGPHTIKAWHNDQPEGTGHSGRAHSLQETRALPQHE